MMTRVNSILLLRPVTFRNTHRVARPAAPAAGWQNQQRPDVGVTDLGQDKAEHQRDEGGEVHTEQLAPAPSVLHVVHAEQLLEAHAANAGHGIQTGQRQCGNAHGHEHGSSVGGHAEHLKETGNAAAEDLERSTGSRGTVGSCGSTGNAQSQNRQQAFKDHGTVADLPAYPSRSQRSWRKYRRKQGCGNRKLHRKPR